MKRGRTAAERFSRALIEINDLAWSKGVGPQTWKLFKDHYNLDKERTITETKRIYDKIAVSYGAEILRRRLHGIENKAIKGFLPARGKVLDAGCGGGRHSIQLARKGCKVVGVDFSRGMIRQAKKRSKHLNIRYRVGDIRRLSFKDDTFDHTVSTLVLNHVKDWKKAVREMVRVTKPIGTLTLSFIHPNRFEGKRTKEYVFDRRKGSLWIRDYRIGLPVLVRTSKCRILGKKEVSDKRFARLVGQKNPDSPILMVVKLSKPRR